MLEIFLISSTVYPQGPEQRLAQEIAQVLLNKEWKKEDQSNK